MDHGKIGYCSPERWHKSGITRALYSAKGRAKKQGVAFNISADYLSRIFPTDSMCPVFEVKMTWGRDKMTSPSLDRIVPERGYTVGNVMWISNRANTLKNANSLDTLKRLVSFYEDTLKVTH